MSDASWVDAIELSNEKPLRAHVLRVRFVHRFALLSMDAARRRSPLTQLRDSTHFLYARTKTPGKLVPALPVLFQLE
ncbi:hypothetical protein [Paraburkholderia phosphatilytica]|uniref:hypothetical protein n=1 Tax=Paraburkholderia phosphatilytica TaxID=2282883 RepID=UPI000F5E4FDD|nr:hypothetical protein [Paraburkholderia phosphatilytica]